MKLSAQEEYGLRCLLRMASRGDEASLSIPEISRAEALSVPNVAKLMRLLRMAGFVKSVRGQAGGYTLAKPAKQIYLGDVLESLGGKLFGAKFCVRHSGLNLVCVHNPDCSLRSLWIALQAMFERVLLNVTLADLLQSEGSMQDFLESRNRTLIMPEPVMDKAASIVS
ncbi:RrF2 family transcriptional regulator [Bryobacter aggregatus]|uniref:RrF2 family transcriptional regulator n=1 Tax=Bryobacter aggregatus TaxID=360054 RepID=UPI0004E12202|nr:Rrf2 family transcriptional regulator [Bryobacter aggregatus]